MNLDLTERVMQQEMAAIVGISSARVSELISSGVLKHGDTVGKWILDYCSRLREEAAGRATDSGMNLANERAKLARVQKHRNQLRLYQDLKNWMPVSLLTEALSKASAQVASALDGIPVQLKRRFPEITGDQMTIIKDQLAIARNAIASADIISVLQLDEDNMGHLTEFEDGNDA